LPICGSGGQGVENGGCLETTLRRALLEEEIKLPPREGSESFQR